MQISFYYSKREEIETEDWLRFLRKERGITKMPDIPAGTQVTLAFHDGKEVCFHRDGLALGHLVIITSTFTQYAKRYNNGHVEKRKTLESDARHLPKFTYWPGNPEDKIVDKPV